MDLKEEDINTPESSEKAIEATTTTTSTEVPNKRTGHFLGDYFGYSGYGAGSGGGYFGNGYGLYGYPYYYPGANYGSTGEFASNCANSYPNRRYSCYGLGR